MTELLTAAQMRALEAAAIASGAVTGLVLMECAGRGVVEAIFAEWPELAAAPFRAVVLCGPGNNGGDGFVVARLLAEWGCEVAVYLYGDAGKLPPDARANYRRWCALGPVQPLTDESLADEAGRAHLAVDALFGIGLNRPFDDLDAVQCALNGWPSASALGATPRVVAVDVPSGLCADSGRYLGCAGENPFAGRIMANLTVTFHAPKLGHYLAQGPQGCGRLRVVPLGLTATPGVAVIDATRAAVGLAKAGGHKFAHGHALVVAGGPGHGGAGRLAARGALRIGAGVVTIACPPEALAENAARLDAVMLRPVADAAALAGVLDDARINALCIGPGLGVSDESRSLVATALKSGRALVLDADALTLIARDATLFAGLHGGCVLTPHGGEFARLFPDLAARLEAPALAGPAFSRLDATREAAARAGCVVLLKGPDTVIAAPDGRCAINAAWYGRAAPWLATAGAGDVLAGFIAGLLARRFTPFDAACAAAWLHVECARRFGPGLIAEDLPEQLPGVLSDLGA
ncbi:MAG: NAD(P)H-hydrate dehydratase [Pseudorhodobacter sp.]|nr:NAD(P)H-hydrate dehydratase [Pseudorhodobacter sp.]